MTPLLLAVSDDAVGLEVAGSPAAPRARPLACSDAELYDHLFHYRRLLVMLRRNGLGASAAYRMIDGLIRPIEAEAEERGIPLHRLGR
ncbi:MAG TPA: hypothetical protein VK002_08580 [Rubricoccaceae bacterium]|nr:hypothetical protein [Rubricoccaceae bacterium]